MTGNKTQDEINQSEWENPENWTSIYFSKKDSRSWVPKKNPNHGWTINFGSPAGGRWIYKLYIIFLILGTVLGAVVTFVVMGAD